MASQLTPDDVGKLKVAELRWALRLAQDYAKLEAPRDTENAFTAELSSKQEISLRLVSRKSWPTDSSNTSPALLMVQLPRVPKVVQPNKLIKKQDRKLQQNLKQEKIFQNQQLHLAILPPRPPQRQHQFQLPLSRAIQMIYLERCLWYRLSPKTR